MSPEKIVVFGITGSIGTNTEKVISAFPEKYSIVGCSCGKNIDKLNEFIEKHQSIKEVCVEIVSQKNNVTGNVNVHSGEEGLLSLLELNPDKIVMALPGKQGWKVTLKAVELGIPVLLANKESLVIAGFFLGREVTSDRSKIIPIDSEHAALMQILDGVRKENIRKVYITASGGALRNVSKEKMLNSKAAQALNHPVWDMGAKVTVDSATMLNKGLELIEAFWLFDVEPEELDVLVHPEVDIHAAVICKDGSSVAQVAPSSMIIPIAAAISYPEMLPLADKFPELVSKYENSQMNFFPPDLDKYPMLKLAINLLRRKDFSGMVAYAISDEVAVDKFLEGDTSVSHIHETVIRAVDHFSNREKPENVDRMIGYIREIEEFCKI
jgi:1-deoxy-D-xylulose-5-phosphate reductoisomerase